MYMHKNNFFVWTVHAYKKTEQRQIPIPYTCSTKFQKDIGDVLLQLGEKFLNNTALLLRGWSSTMNTKIWRIAQAKHWRVVDASGKMSMGFFPHLGGENQFLAGFHQTIF